MVVDLAAVIVERPVPGLGRRDRRAARPRPAATVIVDLAAVVGELPAVVGELAVPGPGRPRAWPPRFGPVAVTVERPVPGLRPP